ncbi:MAG: SOS response-associated peptidase, partial [Donghicola eburneus]
MCGRFAITLPDQAMADVFDAAPSNDLPDTPKYNVCPTNTVHVVVSAEARRIV